MEMKTREQLIDEAREVIRQFIADETNVKIYPIAIDPAYQEGYINGYVISAQKYQKLNMLPVVIREDGV